MPIDPVHHRRLANQRLTGKVLATPNEVVTWLGAVQAQDFAGATWALGQRMVVTTAAAIEATFSRGEFVRTHALRPTWHVLAPADLRWVQALTGPRVQAINASRYRQLGLDRKTLVRGAGIMTEALGGGNAFTRRELANVLQRHGIPTDGQRLAYLVMYAELETLICSGPLQGRQHTYMLVDERVPPAPAVPHDEALALLALRFAISHGPVSPRDLAWWASLTLAEARQAIDLAAPGLQPVNLAGEPRWWHAESPPPASEPSTPVACLLPNYDEFLALHPESRLELGMVPEGTRPIAAAGRLDHHHLVVDGRLAGGWRREVTSRSVRFEIDPFRPLTTAERNAIEVEAHRYASFIAREPHVAWLVR